MNRSDPPLNEKELLSRLKAGSRLAFSELYDRYASALLGIIIKILNNEAESIEVLEKTFMEVRSQADQFQPAKQPLFAWLLGITRNVASDALKKRNSAQTLPFHVIASGQLIAPKLPADHTSSPADTPPDARLNDLLNAVVFKNCTPEEAAASLGMPVGLARQQLRLAMQQARALQQRSR